MSLMLAMLALAAGSGDRRQLDAATAAIRHEIDLSTAATRAQDIDAYMDTVPDDLRILEDDGTTTDSAALRAKQLQAWAIIRRTIALEIKLTKVELGCAGQCATAWTDQRWDRQMLGRDGKTEFNVVTTQSHREKWELRGKRWRQIEIDELGGKLLVDGKPYG